jgi:TonB family protein
MRTAARRRDRRATPATGWVAVVVSVLVHGAILLLLLVHAIMFSEVEGFGATTKAADADELKSGCVGDAMLASSARYAMCFAPWHDDLDACISESQNDMWIDLSSCQARDDKGLSQISMIEPKQAAAIKAIDPEPLLEEMKQQQQQKPVVVPPLQAANTPKPQQPPPRPRPMQVVETVKPSTEKAPDNARFLSEYDTNVEKQSVARGTPKEPMIAKSKPSELAAKDQPQDASVKEHTDRPPGRDSKAPDVPGTLAMRTPGARSPADVEQEQKARGTSAGTDGPMTADGYMSRKGQGSIDQEKHDRSELPHGENGAGGGAPDVPNLKPTQDVLERALGGGNVDHMEDIDNGDETALNSKRWVYASFFNRMKRQVAQNWDPASVWRRNDPTGQVYGFKTRVTEVRVSLSPTGSLAKIIITGPCGVSDLDDEAVRAFHAAAPFPNPPKELAGADNLITFGFSFFFEIGGSRSSWHIQRSM